MSDPTTTPTTRPIFTGPPVPLAVRVPEELATFLELLADINGRSKTDEYRVALEQHVLSAKSDPKVQARVQEVMDGIEREARAKREVLSSILGPGKPAAAKAAPRGASKDTLTAPEAPSAK